jgi:hypothetical protein
MERDYDIFEVLPDGQPIWRAAVAGHENALRVLKQLAVKTTNEVRMMHLPTKAVIAVMNADKSQSDRSDLTCPMRLVGSSFETTRSTST